MTILSAAQEAGQLLLSQQPSGLFSTDAFGRELGVMANRAVTALSRYADWQKLKVLKSYPGDGATIAFDLPSDYGRMLKKAALHSFTWKNANYRPARDEDEWLYLQDTNISGTPGVWILLGGRLQIFPPMPSGETARHYYISKYPVRAADGTPKAKFTVDSDTSVFSEELLTLAIMWRWRSLKRMEYSEDLTNYEIALAEEVTADKGRQPIVVGRQRIPGDVAIAYPGVLGH